MIHLSLSNVLQRIKVVYSGAIMFVLAACGEGSSSGETLEPPSILAPSATVLQVNADLKRLNFTWAKSGKANFYELYQDKNGVDDFQLVANAITATQYALDISTYQFDWENARFKLQACNVNGCAVSNIVSARSGMLSSIGYFKASNTEAADRFGERLALSGDGQMLAVVAKGEKSNGKGVNADPLDNSLEFAGAVYVFQRDPVSGKWSSPAYIKASNTVTDQEFGSSIALDADGTTLAVGARGDQSAASSNDTDRSLNYAGAVFIFERATHNNTWSQQAYIKPEFIYGGAMFGEALALSADGATLVVGSPGEAGSTAGISVSPFTDPGNAQANAGAVYVFQHSAGVWRQQTYIKASDVTALDQFGFQVFISGDSNTLAVTSPGEDSGSSGIVQDGTWPTDSNSPDTGAIYIFARSVSTNLWTQQAFIKRDSNETGGGFGVSLALSFDGNVLAIGDTRFASNTSGQVTIYRRSSNTWFNPPASAKLKSGAPFDGDYFGYALALNKDGTMLVASALYDNGAARGINGVRSSDLFTHSGAAYSFRYQSSLEVWFFEAYIKGSNPGTGNYGAMLGTSLAMSSDAATLAIGARGESSASTFDQRNQVIQCNTVEARNCAESAGAVYLY